MKQSATLDSSFWINAHRCGLLPYVLEDFQLFYASQVAVELRPEFPSGREFWRLVGEGVLIEAPVKKETVREFGPGERAAMDLALEHEDWILLIDDRRPLLAAQVMGIKSLCSPALVASLFHRGRLQLEKALALLARLMALQTVSPVLINLALAQLEQMSRKED